MARLSLSCLGPFQVTLEGRPVTGFKSNKVRALLIYLAVEADRPHRREALAGLLWPEWPDREALSNLRYALSSLRRVIGDRTAEPPFLLTSRETLQFNTASDYRLDVKAFLTQAEFARGLDRRPPDLLSLEKAIALHCGPFLEGFSVSDSAGFEEWVLNKRQQTDQAFISALRCLATSYEQIGQYTQAQAWAQRLIELEPWDEAAHCQLMRSFALSGLRNAALVQYETCRRLLAEELGVEPAPRTTRLYEQIRDGELETSAPLPSFPPDLTAETPRFLDDAVAETDRHVFVARERELARLNHFLDMALARQGGVAFITGEAGSGKTALIQEFVRRSLQAYPQLRAATGNCNAYTGIGDPYLPFRELLEMVTGDVEARWAAGSITKEHARRLWDALPSAVEALVASGPALIDTLIPWEELLERANRYRQWPAREKILNRLEGMRHRGPTGRGTPSPLQSDLFVQYTRVLKALAQRGPLLLVVDDLQWADLGSISLLFHLGRHLAGSRILIIGAYRLEEVSIGRDGERHPLEPVANEFQREFGNIMLDLSQAESRSFVEEFLDSEPNRLGDSFREMLYRQTRGHPLFTSELLRGLRERGDLLRDQEGRWIEGPDLNWETLPARVEAVIAERIGRLEHSLLAALRVASVEGEVFTAEVVAQVQAADERVLVSRLSEELERRHRLIHGQAIKRLGARRLSRYRFRNYLFQRFLYDSLDQAERAYLHEDVGNALEQLYGEQPGEIAAIAPQLAWHFQESEITGKAVQYLNQAGQRAVQLSAYAEGVALVNRGLSLLTSLPNSREKAQLELDLQLTLGMAYPAGQRAIAKGRRACLRARELCEQLGGETSQLIQILGQLASLYYVRADYQMSHELGEEALALARQAGDPLLVAVCHWRLGFVSFGLGQYHASRAHLAKIITFYEPRYHPSLVAFGGADAGVSAMAYDACCLWSLGYPDQAMMLCQQALAQATELGHPFTLADVVAYAGCLLSAMRRDGQTLKNHADELLRLVNEQGVPTWLPEATWHRGEALAMLGQYEEGIAQMRQGMKVAQSSEVMLFQPGVLGSLALAQANAGRAEEGLATLSEALAIVDETGERHWEAELNRLRAKLLLMGEEIAAAEFSLEQALTVARRQEARSWELRAANDLARLRRTQGKRDKARQLLEPIYHWFTEGFDTPDLQEAKRLLEELS